MFYSFGTSFLVAVNGQAHPFPSVIAWNACYISLSCSSLTHQRSRRESPYLSQLPPTKPRDLLGYWIHSIRCSVNLVKHFHLIILYPMLMCFTFPLRILTHIQSKPKPPSNQFVSIAVRATMKEMKMTMTTIKTGWKKDEDTGKTRSQARSRYLWLRSQCQALWWSAKEDGRHVFLPMQSIPLATMRTWTISGPNHIFKLGLYCSEESQARPSIIPSFLVMCHTL